VSRTPLGTLADPCLHIELARSVRRRVDAADVDDVVQATLLEAMKAQAVLHGREDLRRFVFWVARQKVVDWHRHRGRERDRTLPAEELGAQTEPATDLLRWALGVLPPGKASQETLSWLLREGDGETLAEIAAAEHVPAPLVRKRVSRLRRYFRQRWSKEAAALALLLVATMALLWRGRVRHSGIDPDAVSDRAPAGDSRPATNATVDRMQLAPNASASVAPIPSARPSVPARPSPPSVKAVPLPFSRSDAERAINWVQVVRSCGLRRPFRIRFAVTFDPSGTVSSVQLGPDALAETKDGECVARVLGRAKVPAFVGNSETLRFDIRMGESVPKSAASSQRPASCTPPYTVDEHGGKHFKAECLR
jgi:RNA polymerase sigma factor (sigma-70 family)